MAQYKRQWRSYKTAGGADPVGAFLDDLTDEEMAQVAAAMLDVKNGGLHAAKHLRGDIYEVIADSPTRSFRVLFAAEGRYGQVLLAVVAFAKKTQKTPGRMTWRTSGSQTGGEGVRNRARTSALSRPACRQGPLALTL
jgi:phage-related protein